MMVIKFIKIIISVILVSIFIFLLTIFIYYNTNKEILGNYICPNFSRILAIDSIYNYTKKQFKLSRNNNQLLKTIKLLLKLQKQKERIFRGIGSLFTSSGKHIMLPGNKNLLIIDTGWHSLYLSTSFLAIKSIYNENKNYKISDKELTIKRKTIRLYKISFKNSRDNIFLIIHKNLVFISQNQEAISRSFHCFGNHSKDRIDSNNLMLSKNKTKQIFKRLFNTPFYNFKNGSSYSIWSLYQQKNRLLIKGKIMIKKSPKASLGKHYRVLNSNQYKFQGYKIIPKTFTEAFILLFDDMEEIYSIVSNKKIPAREKLLTKKYFRWTANELGIFRNKNSNFLFIRAADIKKLKKQIDLLIKLKNIANKKNLIMPGFIQNLRKAWHLKKRFRCYTRINSYLIFAENNSNLKELKKTIANKKTISKIDSSLLHYGKGDKNNFIFIWKTKRPYIPLIRKISSIIRRNIGNKKGIIRGSFHKDFISINGMLK